MLRTVAQDPLRAVDLTAAEWSFRLELVRQMADRLGCDQAGRVDIARQLREQGGDFLTVLVHLAIAHALPIVDRFDFWRLAHPGCHVLRIETPTHAGFVAIPAGRAGADLFEGAVATIGQGVGVSKSGAAALGKKPGDPVT
ncbi:hypothetical protein JHS3_14120 [Jeongeupia sp. HS-3]|nr:hypothetical protein JHS3_14120 [Jeongeupia sp. HS-3]